MVHVSNISIQRDDTCMQNYLCKQGVERNGGSRRSYGINLSIGSQGEAKVVVINIRYQSYGRLLIYVPSLPVSSHAVQ